MIIRFEATTDVKLLDKETLFAFLNACNGKKHTQALKYDNCEPCKKIFDIQNLDEMFAFYVQYAGILLKGKNGFWINVTSRDFAGIITWDGAIKVKNPKKKQTK